MSTTPRRRRLPGKHPADNGNETQLARTRRARRINRTLAQAYPDAHCELDFDNPLQLAVATILSAQTTDVRVNQVTPKLFAKYRSAKDYAEADRTELEELIRPTGFYRNKANSLIGLGRDLLTEHDGQVPKTLTELVKLPGIGRKTANVILGNAFDIPGLTVDTHFQRLMHRLALTDQTDAVKIELAIQPLIEKSQWTQFSHRIIFHGRRVCHSRQPACGACLIAYDCPSYGKSGPTDPEKAAKLIKSPDRDHLIALAESENANSTD